MVKTTKHGFWSHDGQKDWFVIFGRGAAKMGEISRRIISRPLALCSEAKFSLQGKNLEIWPILSHLKNAIPCSGRTLVKKTKSKFSGVGRQKWMKFQGGILSRPLTSCSGAKFSLQGTNFSGREYFAPKHGGRGPKCFPPMIFSWKFHSFWPPHSRKFRFGLSDPACDQNLGSPFWGATKWVKFPHFCLEEIISFRNITPVVPTVSLLEISPILATPWPKILIQSFWPTCDQDLGSHFEVRQNGSNFQMFSLEREFRSGTWPRSSRKYPSWKFHPFLPPHARKLWFGLFDRHATRTWPGIAFWGATKYVKFPNFCQGERILHGNMTPVVSKVSLLEISPILAAPWPKITNGRFDRLASKWWFWPACE